MQYVLTENNKLLLFHHLFEAKRLDYGVEFGFLPISKTKGLKLSYYKYCRDFSLYRQEKLAKHGLAPKTYGVCDIAYPKVRGGKKKSVIYGYVTQIAKKLPGKCSWENRARRLSKHAEELTGLRMMDTHKGNFGLINDNLVIIDCGPCSFTSYDKSYH